MCSPRIGSCCRAALVALCALVLASAAHGHGEESSLFQIIRFERDTWAFQVNAPLLALAEASVDTVEEPLTPAIAASPDVRQQMVRYIREASGE